MIERGKNWLMNWFMQRPIILRSIFYLIRDKFPVLVFKNSAIVFRYQDVADVMQRDKDFTVESLIAPRVVTGKFLLSMDDGDMYRRQELTLKQVGCPVNRGFTTDISESIATKAEKLATKILSQLNTDTDSGHISIDVIKDYCEPVVAQVVAQHILGLTINDSELRGLIDDLNNLAKPILVPTVESLGAADESAKNIKKRMQHSKPIADSLFARVLSKQIFQHDGVKINLPMDEDDAKRIIIGLSIAGFAPVVKTFAQAIDQLIQRKDYLDEISMAIAVNDNLAVRQYIYEALRFNPTFPFLVRHCPRETTIGSGKHQRKVNAGSVVTVALLSAMFDPQAIGEPTRFRTDRELTDYFHFGHGLHECYGEKMAMQMVMAMIKELLNVANKGHESTLQRNEQSSQKGHIKYERSGPVVKHLHLKYQPRVEL